MGDFFTPPEGFNPVPPDPETPPPEFEKLATSLGIGLSKSGWVGQMVASIVDGLLLAFTRIVGWLLSSILKVLALVFRVLGNVSEEASSGYGDLVAATLKDLLGVDVDPASVSTRRGGPDRQAVANKLGATIINTFFSGVAANPAGGITPSADAANSFLAVVMNMELNGWLEGWLSDAVSVHLLEKYGELKDGISHSLGLGRLSRQVFSAPLQVLVHEPYLALLHQKYRSKPLDQQTALRAFFRGEFSRDYLSTALGNQGYSEQEIEWLITDHQKPISIGDIDYLLQRGTWTNADASQELQGQGYAANTADHIVAALNDRRIQKYRMELVGAAEQAFIEGNIPFDQWQAIAQSSGLADEEISWLLKVAGAKREFKVTHLSLGQIEQGILDGVLNLNDLQTWATRVNMPPDEEKYLELMILTKQNKESASEKAKAAAAGAKAQAEKQKTDAAAAKVAQLKSQAPDKGVTITQAESLVVDGLWTFDHLASYLAARDYSADAIASISALLHHKIGTTQTNGAIAAGVRSSAAAKGLSLAETEKAVVAGVLALDDLRNFLTAQGYSASDAEVIVQLTEQAKEAADAKAAARSGASAKLGARQISLADLERAVRLGLTTMDVYNAALTAAGFDHMAITLLDGILNSEIASDKVKGSGAAARAGAGTSKGITLAQLGDEVANGIRPIGDYTAELATLGYSAADQQGLTALLQLRVDQAKVTAAKVADAAAKLAARGISLQQAERAVKLGVIPIATYRQLLQSVHFMPDAVDVLANTLQAELAATRKAQTATNGAAAALSKQGISLADLQRAVIAGLRPIAEYTSTLTAARYSPEDAKTLTDLLQLKAQQAADAAVTHADAEGNATRRGISLGDEEKAVIAGIEPMESYDALLTSLGYDDLDRAILEYLLQTKIDAAAAKAGGGGSAGDGGSGA